MIYPIALKLAGRTVVVVGGGAVALQKVRTLLPAGAAVTVVSPAFDPRLRRLADSGALALRRKRFTPGDLRGAALAIGATDDPDVNRAVFRAARRRRILVNVVDTPDQCDFYVPAVLRRRELAIAISTSGGSPGLSRRIRLELGRLYGKAFGAFLRDVAARRRALRAAAPDPAARRAIVSRMTSPSVLRALRQNGMAAARRRLGRISAAAVVDRRRAVAARFRG